MSVRRVLLVGLGRIARTHLAVLDRLARAGAVRVVAGVDPRPADDVPVPVLASLAEGLRLEPDVVVLATPTDTHVDLASTVLQDSTALVLSEKPLARTPAEVAALQARHGAAVVADRVKVAHHFAFSPEVEEAVRLVAAHPEWGTPTRVLSVFTDAYGALPAAQRASLVSSFVDSAPNQLSVVAAFADELRPVSHAAAEGRAATTLRHRGGHTVLSSNWLAGASSKHTVVEFLDGRVRLDVEHSSMTVLVTEDERVVAHAAYGSDVERKEAHYLGVYDALLRRPADPRLGVPLAVRIAELLDEAAALPPAVVDWTELRP